MNYVRGLAPWICYGVLSLFDWRLAMGAAAVVALVLLVGQIRRFGADLLGTVTAVFFVVMTVIAVADPTSGLRFWPCALSNGTLAAVAFTSVALHRPFTLSFARAQVPEEIWNAPRFIQVNMVVSSAWAVAFAFGTIASALIIGLADVNILLLVVAQVIEFVGAVVFTRKYTGHVQRAAEQQQRVAVPAA